MAREARMQAHHDSYGAPVTTVPARLRGAALPALTGPPTDLSCRCFLVPPGPEPRFLLTGPTALIHRHHRQRCGRHQQRARGIPP